MARPAGGRGDGGGESVAVVIGVAGAGKEVGKCHGEGGFEHGEAGADDAGVGFDRGPDGGD